MRAETQRAVAAFERALDQSLTVLDPANGDILQQTADALCCDLTPRLAVLDEIAQRGRPEIVDEVSPLVMLALPLPVDALEPPLVAVAMFVTDTVRVESQVAAAASAFGVPSGALFRWAQSRVPWHPQAALQDVPAVVEKSATQQHAGPAQAAVGRYFVALAR